MTDTPYAPPPTSEPPPPSPLPRPALRRRRDDRVLGGVCSGLARYLGVDPVLVRVIVVVLALMGGGGVLVYLAAWLLIPEDGREESAAQQLVGGGNSQTALVVIIAVVVGLTIALPMSGLWFGMGPDFGAPAVLLILAAIALVVWLVRRDESPPGPQVVYPTSPPSATEVTTMTNSPGQQTAVLPVPEMPLPPPPEPAAPRSVLGLLTISAAALVAGSLVTVGLVAEDSAINVTSVFAATLAVVGVGLLIGSVVGRSRGLIVLGVALTLATAASAAVSSVDVSGGVGERNWQPLTSAEAAEDFRLGIGDATLDLRDLQIPEGGLGGPITVSVGVGQLTVYVPDGVDVELNANVRLGQINVPGRPTIDGSGNELPILIDVPNETAVIVLDAEVGIGELTVEQSRLVGPDLFQQGVPR